MINRLRIAIVGPLWYPLPPRGYGGTELVVHLLHHELRRLGHSVRVFGVEGSAPPVEALAEAAWSCDLGRPAQPLREAAYLARVFRRLDGERFDVVHDHTGPTGLLLAANSRLAPVVVHTIHGALSEPAVTFYREVEDRVRLVALTTNQAATASGVRVTAVVNNAVEVPMSPLVPDKDSYLLEIARICPDKGQHLAIEVAQRTGRRLILAGKVEATSEATRYFEERIRPHLGNGVEYYPNVAGELKAKLIAHAAAGIFPLQWPEPFGLAMAECMVAGTPVLALTMGSAAELIEPGVTGFLADGVEQLVAAVGLLDEVDPAGCAALARARFSPRRMAEGYLAVYRQPLLAAIPAKLPINRTLDRAVMRHDGANQHVSDRRSR